MSWQILTDERALDNWDADLIKFSEYSTFQTRAFGEYNRALGWQPIFLKNADETGAARAMMLGFLRRYPLGIGLMWCPGGPIGDVSLWNSELQQTIVKTAKLKRLYCRFRCDRERNTSDALALNHAGWTRSWFIMHSSFTMELDLSADDAKLLESCTKSWRQNLRRGEKNNLRISLWTNPNAEEAASVFEEMQERKNLPEQFSADQLKHLFESASEHLVLLRCEDENGDLVALRGCLIIRDRACDYLAATTARGRELRCSNKVFFELLKECRKRGVRFYDLGGIDPHENPGVYEFKRGTGARAVECLGEWNWATSEWMLWFGNWAMQKRHLLSKLSLKGKKASPQAKAENLANLMVKSKIAA